MNLGSHIKIIIVILFLTFQSCIEVRITKSTEKNVGSNVGANILNRIPFVTQCSANEFKDLFKECDSLLLDSLVGTKMILAGELHYFENNYQLKLEFIKYLHERKKINDVIIEYPVSYQRLYTRFLSHTSNRLLTNLNYLSLDSTNEKKFILRLDEYNKTLPDLEKIKIHCVDVEKNSLFAFEALYQTFPKKEIPKELLKAYSLLKQADKRMKIKPRKDKQLIDFLIKDFDKSKEKYEGFLLENATTYKSILEGLRIGLLSDINSKDFLIERENFIYKNIISIMNSNKSMTAFAQLGLAHCSLMKDDTVFSEFPFESIAYKLQNNFDSPVKNKVFSMMQYYTNYDNEKYQNCFLDSSKATIVSRSPKQISLFYRSNSDNINGYLKRFNFLIVNKCKLNEGNYE